MLEALGSLTGTAISLKSMLLNLAAATALSLVLRWHFVRFGSVIGNRREFARNLPLITLTTTMIIGIVHASVALSLGLVGAVSIVRFRTPVKEPEELGYLFLAIVIGFGLGAEQVLLTSVSALAILAGVAAIKFTLRKDQGRIMFLSITDDDKADGIELTRLTATVAPFAQRNDLRRVDVNGKSFEAIYSVEVRSLANAASMVESIKGQFPRASVTLIDQNQMPVF